MKTPWSLHVKMHRDLDAEVDTSQVAIEAPNGDMVLVALDTSTTPYGLVVTTTPATKGPSEDPAASEVREAVTQDDFAHAWADLGERLDSGLSNLHLLTERVVREEDRTRLHAKIAGLSDAVDLHRALSETLTNSGGTYADAWLRFTREATALLIAEGKAPGYYQGMHLALTYQRGYGAAVDAPRIANPHV